MDIRALDSKERLALLDLLDAWELSDGWRGRDFFARSFDCDPTFVPENVWVAAEGDHLHGCVQIVPRRLRVLGHAVPAGGIGTVFTRFDSRGVGVATALLERSVEVMTERGMELSLLFSPRTGFYEKRGWKAWKSQRTVLRPGEGPAPEPVPTADVEIRAFDRRRDLEAVMAIHSAYSATRNGTVVRDGELWEASLSMAGNPDEEFWVACRDGAVMAYARCTLLNAVFTVIELARRDEGAAALAALMKHVLTPTEDDPFAPPGKSQELRAFALLPSFDDIPFTVALENHQITAHPMVDPTAMLRCLDVEALSRRLDVTLFPKEDAAGFLQRILPPDHLVFWPSDRF